MPAWRCADVADRLMDEARPTRMVGARIGDRLPGFTFLVPMFGLRS
jgi:hypothetical protein